MSQENLQTTKPILRPFKNVEIIKSIEHTRKFNSYSLDDQERFNNCKDGEEIEISQGEGIPEGFDITKSGEKTWFVSKLLDNGHWICLGGYYPEDWIMVGSGSYLGCPNNFGYYVRPVISPNDVMCFGSHMPTGYHQTSGPITDLGCNNNTGYGISNA